MRNVPSERCSQQNLGGVLNVNILAPLLFYTLEMDILKRGRERKIHKEKKK